jgi:hypothetical protein
MTEHEKAYIAGIVDGEGNISLVSYAHKEGKTGFCISPIVQITGTNLEFMVDINALVKGTIYVANTRVKANHKPKIIIWFRGKNKICEFLKEISPYLRLKKKQSEIMIGYCERRKGVRSVYDEIDFEDARVMKKLNTRGLPVNN